VQHVLDEERRYFLINLRQLASVKAKGVIQHVAE
jgi:hypothetical protein